MQNADPSSFLARHEFLIRRLHSLSGLIPVGAYMCVHLAVNASVLNGAGMFQENVDMIHRPGPIVVLLLEWVFIFIPILFHAILGVVFIAGGMKTNTNNYSYWANIRYVMQRVTGMIAFVFILSHVLHMHDFPAQGKEVMNAVSPSGAESEEFHEANREGIIGRFSPDEATSSTAAALTPLWLQVLYAIGVSSCVFHLANGLWTMGITWGVTVSPESQRRSGYVCAAFGAVMLAVGLSALVGFRNVDQD
ncbi:MAG: succinate dehydrogenase cytochrome b558 subunit, partial [Planctomycetales bacterium]